MALLGSFTKQPAEQLPVDISYADVIGARTASSIVPTVTVPSGMTSISSVVTGSVLQIYLGTGTTGQTYRWVVRTSITIGGLVTIVEDEFDVVVLEV